MASDFRVKTGSSRTARQREKAPARSASSSNSGSGSAAVSSSVYASSASSDVASASNSGSSTSSSKTITLSRAQSTAESSDHRTTHSIRRRQHIQKNQRSQSNGYSPAKRPTKIDKNFPLPEPSHKKNWRKDTLSKVCNKRAKDKALSSSQRTALATKMRGNDIYGLEIILANFRQDYPSVDKKEISKVRVLLFEKYLENQTESREEIFCEISTKLVNQLAKERPLRKELKWKQAIFYLNCLHEKGLDFDKEMKSKYKPLERMFDRFCCSKSADLETFCKIFSSLPIYTKERFNIFDLVHVINSGFVEYEQVKKIADTFFKDDFREVYHGNTPALEFIKYYQGNAGKILGTNISSGEPKYLTKFECGNKLFFEDFANKKILDTKDSTGNTVLHYSTYDESLYRALIEKGANPKIKNNDGISAAKKFENDEDKRQAFEAEKESIRTKARNEKKKEAEQKAKRQSDELEWAREQRKMAEEKERMDEYKNLEATAKYYNEAMQRDLNEQMGLTRYGGYPAAR